jgi:phosphohistidine phosphatase SixA
VQEISYLCIVCKTKKHFVMIPSFSKYVQYFFSVSIIVTFAFLTGCEKEDKLPALALTTDIADSTMVNIDTAIRLTANIPVIWKLTEQNGGVISNISADSLTITYTTPKVAGVYTLKILNRADTTAKILRTFIVTSKIRIFNSLRRGGYVLSFRHGLATTGADQLSSAVPNWWKSCEATLARQLDNPAGRVQSEKTGKALKLLKIPVGRVISSEYCRCLQTVQFMNLGINTETSPFLTYYVYDEVNRYANTFRLIREQTISNRNIIFSTHVGFAFVPPTLNPVLNGLQMGDAAVFKLNPDGVEPTFAGVLTSADFTNLIK